MEQDDSSTVSYATTDVVAGEPATSELANPTPKGVSDAPEGGSRRHRHSPKGDVNAVVIGAGPYGLAAASHLAGTGVTTRVIGSTMAGWADFMPKGMFLKSTAIDSSIGTPRPGFSITDYCHHAGITPYDDGGGERPIPIDEFIAYGEWFQHHLVPEVEPDEVSLVSRSGRGYTVTLASGEEFRATSVVVAVGTEPFAYSPPVLASEVAASLRRSGVITHVSAHADLSLLSGQRVAIVGAGQSALESAVLLSEAGAKVHVIVRGERVLWAGPPRIGERTLAQRVVAPAAPLGAGWGHLVLTKYAAGIRHLPAATRVKLVRHILGPAGSWWLHERFGDEVDVRIREEILDVEVAGDGLSLVLGDPSDPSQATNRLAVDRVIAATGYRVDVRSLGFLDDALKPEIRCFGGYPVLSAGYESSSPGLFFTGLSSAGSFGPMMRFVAGTDFAGRRVVRGISRRLAAS